MAVYRKVLFILLISCICLGQGNSVFAKSIQELKREINQLEKEKKQKDSEQKSIESRMSSLEKEKQQARSEIKSLDNQIGQTREQIAQTEQKMNQTKQRITKLEEEIAEAQRQIELRDELLKTRVRQIYESDGNISFLDIILGASSFGDLLVRLDFIKLLVDQDQKIINDYIAAKKVVEDNKAEVDKLLVQLQEQQKSLETLQASLQDQRKQKTITIASIEQEQGELAELDEQMQEEVLQLINEVAAKRNEVLAKQQQMAAANSPGHNQSSQQQVTSNGGKLGWPVPASSRITSSFGGRVHPITGKPSGHKGIDIGASTPKVDGDDIVAAESGTVIIAQYLNGYGYSVVIDHGGNLRTLYGHIREGGIKVSVGDSVNKGDKIAEMGSTGNSTGSHLHFEVHQNGVQVDPMPFLR